MGFAIRTSCLSLICLVGCTLYDPDLYRNRDGSLDGMTDGTTDGPVDPNDLDGDGVANADDICPNAYDPGQNDLDRDGQGNACDADGDGDGNTDPEVAVGFYKYGDLIDFMYQDTCTNTSGTPVADDPYDCRSRGLIVRNHGLDEPLLIYRHDQPDGTQALGYQATTSVPFRITGSRIGVLNMMDFTAGSLSESRAYREFDRYGLFSATNATVSPGISAPIDGYEVTELTWTGASIFGTCASTGVTLLNGRSPIMASQCVFDDAQLIARMDRVPNFGSQSAVIDFKAGTSCPASLDSHYTEWTVTQGFEFTAGKTMDALISDSYQASTIEGSSQFDRYYFTRPYGKTRWERWQRSGTEKAEGCNGPTSANGFVRVDCREWTVVELDPQIGSNPGEGGYDVRAWPVDRRLGFGNLVTNHDFGDQDGSMITGWATSNASVTATLESASTGLLARNTHMAFSTTSIGSDRYVSTDVLRGTLDSNVAVTVGVGLRVWSTQSGSFTLRVSYVNTSNVEVGSQVLLNAVTVTATPTRRFISLTVPATGTTERIRIQLIPGLPNRTYYADDVWLTRL